MRLGVLDIGSNTVHLLIVDAHYGAAPIPAHSRKIELRLAEHLKAGSITNAAREALTDFVSEALVVAEDLGASAIEAFATSAIREADNGTDVIEHVATKTGVDIDLLSGSDEARLTFLAVRRWFGWSRGQLLLLDIGGGSLEIAAGRDEEPEVAISLQLGAGRMTRMFLNGDPASEKSLRKLRKHARLEIASEVGRVRRTGDRLHAVGTSKTFKQLARIAGAAPSADGIYVPRQLSRASLNEQLPKLAEMGVADLAQLPGVSAGRAGQLLAGAVVAEAAMDLFEISELQICPWALREGVILQRLDGLKP
ncbi:MAG: Ppx/GppA family phosphatase [Actinomycetia bacterium]|nr:Ppx/GppA family phosphatase [Actinomycetes bacterium]